MQSAASALTTGRNVLDVPVAAPRIAHHRCESEWSTTNRLGRGCSTLTIGRLLRSANGYRLEYQRGRTFGSKPFMLGPTNRAVNVRKKDRGGVEASAIGNDAGRDIVSRLWAFDHDGTH